MWPGSRAGDGALPHPLCPLKIVLGPRPPRSGHLGAQVSGHTPVSPGGSSDVDLAPQICFGFNLSVQKSVTRDVGASLTTGPAPPSHFPLKVAPILPPLPLASKVTCVMSTGSSVPSCLTQTHHAAAGMIAASSFFMAESMSFCEGQRMIQPTADGRYSCFQGAYCH